jgi:SAM-dependent methyltransferase
MPDAQLESWESPQYAVDWASEDVVADMLELPRRISVALVADSGIDVRHVVDVGSGPGTYLERFLRAFPEARGTWIDVSDAMRELAQEKLGDLGERVTYVIGDAERLAELEVAPAEVVVSSRVFHHFSPESLRAVYGAIHEWLTPGGFAINLDHVGPHGDWEQVYRRIREQFTGKRKRPLSPHRQDHPFVGSDEHAALLREAGFEPADTPWRMFYTALLVARKPA